MLCAPGTERAAVPSRGLQQVAPLCRPLSPSCPNCPPHPTPLTYPPTRLQNNSINVCRYSYSAAVIGIVFLIPIMCAPCLPGVAIVLLSAFQFIWWLAYAITATGGQAASD